VSLNWNFQRGGGSNQKPSIGGVWIFSGTTHFELPVSKKKYMLQMFQNVMKVTNPQRNHPPALMEDLSFTLLKAKTGCNIQIKHFSL